MNAENLDPATQAQTIWSDTLALIKQNSRLTAREQGWLAGVTAEAVFGTTIVLDVENAQTLQVLQTELNEPLMGALEIANGGSPMFPAFKVMPPAQPEPQTTASPEDSGSRAAEAQGAAKESVQPNEDPRPLGIPRSRPATLARRRRNARIPLYRRREPTGRPWMAAAKWSMSRHSNPWPRITTRRLCRPSKTSTRSQASGQAWPAPPRHNTRRKARCRVRSRRGSQATTAIR